MKLCINDSIGIPNRYIVLSLLSQCDTSGIREHLWKWEYYTLLLNRDAPHPPFSLCLLGRQALWKG